MTRKPNVDTIDEQAEREGHAIFVIERTYDHLLGNCTRSTVSHGSSEADGDNPWGDLAIRQLEECR